MLEELGYSDQAVVDDAIQGFRTMGRVPPSDFFPKSFTPAEKTETEFWRLSSWRTSIASTLAVPSGDNIVDQELWQKSLRRPWRNETKVG